MKAYKLFHVRKDGSIGSLFINRSARLPMKKWLDAESYPTKGYKYRPGWHCLSKPVAPHLSDKNRRWYEVEIKDATIETRPKNQGGTWFVANKMRIVKEIDNNEV